YGLLHHFQLRRILLVVPAVNPVTHSQHRVYQEVGVTAYEDTGRLTVLDDPGKDLLIFLLRFLDPLFAPTRERVELVQKQPDAHLVADYVFDVLLNSLLQTLHRIFHALKRLLDSPVPCLITPRRRP